MPGPARYIAFDILLFLAGSLLGWAMFGNALLGLGFGGVFAGASTGARLVAGAD